MTNADQGVSPARAAYDELYTALNDGSLAELDSDTVADYVTVAASDPAPFNGSIEEAQRFYDDVMGRYYSAAAELRIEAVLDADQETRDSTEAEYLAALSNASGYGPARFASDILAPADAGNPSALRRAEESLYFG